MIIKKRIDKWTEQVDMANTATEGLRMLKFFDYDVVLVNLNMPVMNGFEFTQQLRILEKRRGNNIDVIGLTALSHPMMPLLSTFSGVNEYIVKSVDYRELEDKLINKDFLHQN
ncbi:MAG TPA: hypothetical protein DDY13_20135 [Cytophagales bacterium]|jgi:DNA-binding response OmpR family regulator|nr:hypothetical protein [Cytophagales bacterium]